MRSSIASQIRSNYLKTYLSVAILTAIVGILGSLISYFFGWGLTGTGCFLIAAGIIDFVSFYYSDKVVLKISGATPLSPNQLPELHEIVARLCNTAKIPRPSLYLLNDNSMNAFATGRDINHAAVALTKGLIQKMTPLEVEAVVAHELSHIRNNDMRTMAVISILAGFISIVADFYWTSLMLSRADEKDSSGILATIGAILSIFAPLSAFLIKLATSRNHEFNADAGAAELTNNPQALITALRRLSMEIKLPKRFCSSTAHLYFCAPNADSLLEKMFSTHPPIIERIAHLETLV